MALSLQDAGERVLARVEALEADRSRLDGRIVDAYAALHVVLGEQLALRVAGTAAAAAAGISAHELVLAEVTTATTVPPGEAPPPAARHRQRLRRAPRPARGRDGVAAARHPDRRGVRRAGRRRGTGRRRAGRGDRAGHRAGAGPAAGRLPPGPRADPARLTRVLKSLQTRPRRSGAAPPPGPPRPARATLTEDGMARFELRTGAEQVVAITDWVEKLARAMRQAGTRRSLDQLRADLAAEALLRHGYGPPPPPAPPTPPPSPSRAADQPRRRRGRRGPTAAPADRGEVRAGERRGLRVRPDRAAGQRVDRGPVRGRHRRLRRGLRAARARLGHRRARPRHHHRPRLTLALARGGPPDRAGAAAGHRPVPAHLAMTEQVRALDGHCRGPGCQVLARRCDLDHHVPYPHGPTTVANLGPLHRRHHNLKTAGLWSLHPGHRRRRWPPAPPRPALGHPDRTRLPHLPESWTGGPARPTLPAAHPTHPANHRTRPGQEHRDHDDDEEWRERLGWDKPPPF